jgi:hypothetical protein
VTLGGFRSFLRGRLDTLGFREWEDGFNNSNIPSSILDKSYHIKVDKIASGPANHLHHVFIFPTTIFLFLKGYRNPSLAIDQGLDAAQNIFSEILDPAQRLQTDGLKDIRPRSVDVVPVSDSNDNAIVVQIELEGYLIFKF